MSSEVREDSILYSLIYTMRSEISETIVFSIG